jgi:hypothetical protein
MDDEEGYLLYEDISLSHVVEENSGVLHSPCQQIQKHSYNSTKQEIHPKTTWMNKLTP